MKKTNENNNKSAIPNFYLLWPHNEAFVNLVAGKYYEDYHVVW